MTFFLEHITPNPTMEVAKKAVEEARGMNATRVISKGGGSTIDVGKWVARELKIPHHVVPTTAGTGSEVTKYCVLTVDGKKKTFTDPEFIPTSYILNPAETVTCSKELTLSTALDAYCQAIESVWSKNATQESEIYADTAAILIEENLQKVLDNPKDERARMNMLIAANFSGRAINIARTNICHAISYPLTDFYGIPHGIACAMSLRYFARKAATPVDNFLDKFWLPQYRIDPTKVADEAIKHEKMKDVDFEVSREDIIQSLCT